MDLHSVLVIAGVAAFLVGLVWLGGGREDFDDSPNRQNADESNDEGAR